MVFTFLLGNVLVCAGAQPYLGARIGSGDEMIDGVLSPRGLRPLGLWRPTSAVQAGGGSIAGAGRKGIGLMWASAWRSRSGGGVDERRVWLVVGRGECVVAEFAQDVVGAPAEFARDRQTSAVVVDPLCDFQVVGVVG